MSNTKAFLVGLGCLLAITGGSVVAAPFFHDGSTQWKIHVSDDAHMVVTYAAEELRDALKTISGADFEIVTSAPDGPAIIIGDQTNPLVQAQAAALKLDNGPEERIAVYTLGNQLYLAGNEPRGALYAVYSFLRNELDARWLWPGESGAFLPARASWSLPQLAYNFVPSFAYRGFHLTGDRKARGQNEEFLEWEARNFMNYYGHVATPAQRRMGFYSVMGGHGMRLPRELFQEQPELFAERDGRRIPDQICYTNPKTLERMVQIISESIRNPWLTQGDPEGIDMLGIIPPDNRRFCQCSDCAQLDSSSLWFDFHNRFTDAIRKEFPHMKFRSLAYAWYRQPPEIPVRNLEFVLYGIYDRCNVNHLSDPNQSDNANILRALGEWEAKDIPMGLAAYEHGVFRTVSMTNERGTRFLPFLSMFEDQIRTSHGLGHVAMVTERHLIAYVEEATERTERLNMQTLVPTPEYQYDVQHRLTSYLFVRLMWDIDQSLPEVLRDWCETIFGPAAQPMFDYYLMMDAAWDAMPVDRLRILNNSARTAPLLLANNIPARARVLFDAAQERVAEIADPVARERAEEALRRERVFLRQWENSRNKWETNDPLRMTVLYRGLDNDEMGLADAYSKPQALIGTPRNVPATQVRLAWSDDALLVRWDCPDPQASDRVTLTLTDGFSGRTWQFTATYEGGAQSSCEGCPAGDRGQDADWTMESRTQGNQWTALMTIPFETLGHPGIATESWDASFARQRGRQTEVFPEGDAMAALYLSIARQGSRTVLWWQGWQNYRDQWLENEFGNYAAFEVRPVSTVEELARQSEGVTDFWIQNPGGSDAIPDAFWSQVLVPAVREGAVAVFGTRHQVPLELDRYFNDPSLAIRLEATHRHANRRPSALAPGNWQVMPNDLLTSFWPPLNNTPTPGYAMIPVHPEGWIVLGEAPFEGDKTAPFMLARPYGKGMIVVMDVNQRIPRPRLLDNLILYNKQRTAAQ